MLMLNGHVMPEADCALIIIGAPSPDKEGRERGGRPPHRRGHVEQAAAGGGCAGAVARGATVPGQRAGSCHSCLVACGMYCQPDIVLLCEQTLLLLLLLRELGSIE